MFETDHNSFRIAIFGEINDGYLHFIDLDNISKKRGNNLKTNKQTNKQTKTRTKKQQQQQQLKHVKPIANIEIKLILLLVLVSSYLDNFIEKFFSYIMISCCCQTQATLQL